MIATCPNCAIASVEEWRAAESKILDNAKKLAVTARGCWQGVASRMDSLDQRFRYVLAFLFGSGDHRSRTSPRYSYLWRDLPRRNSLGCANGHSSGCARNDPHSKKAAALTLLSPPSHKSAQGCGRTYTSLADGAEYIGVLVALWPFRRYARRGAKISSSFLLPITPLNAA
jgi:hypothetical protein